MNGIIQTSLAGHVLFSLLPGNGYDKVLEESAVEETGGSNKSSGYDSCGKVAFSKEREAGDSGGSHMGLMYPGRRQQ